ncbi:MAG: TerB family tellurite resistance protein [bacterium]|nr:TerB family tellurite resistance protein [bacterium]
MKSFLKSLISPNGQKAGKNEPVSLALAVCVLLLETAQADDEFTSEERDRLLKSLQVRFSLSVAEAAELMQSAEARRSESLDLWQFTHRINEALDGPGKQKVIEEVWRIIYADGKLDAHEDYLVHQLARLLNLTHEELIAGKLKAKGESK